MLRTFLIPTFILSLACLTSGQDLTQLIGSLSSSCQAAAGGLLTSDFGTCADVISLVPILGAPGSIVPPLSDYVNVTCPSAGCNNSTLDTALASVQKGCAEDLNKGVSTAILLVTIIANYNTFRHVLCAQYGSNGTYCTTTLLTNIEKSTGKNITFPVLASILLGGFSTLAPMLAPVPKNLYCDACGHALYTEITSLKPIGPPASNTTSTKMDNLVSAICGASFVDGKIPDTIRQAPPGNSTSASGNMNGMTGMTGMTGGSAAGSASANAGMVLKPSHFVPLLLFVIACFTTIA